MKFRSRRTTDAADRIRVSLIGIPLAQGQAASQAKPPTSDQVFKKSKCSKAFPWTISWAPWGSCRPPSGLTARQCRSRAGTEKVDWGGRYTKEVIARKTVLMMAAINKDNFMAGQMVTCWELSPRPRITRPRRRNSKPYTDQVPRKWTMP